MKKIGLENSQDMTIWFENLVGRKYVLNASKLDKWCLDCLSVISDIDNRIVSVKIPGGMTFERGVEVGEKRKRMVIEDIAREGSKIVFTLVRQH